MTIGELKQLIAERNEIGGSLSRARLYASEISYTNGPQAFAAKREVKLWEDEYKEACAKTPLMLDGLSADQFVRYVDCDDSEQIEDVAVRVRKMRTVN